MSFINKAIRRGFKAPAKRHPESPIDMFTIKLHDGGSIIEGLTIVDAWGGPRDLMVLPAEHRKGSMGNLTEPGHVHFITAKGKNFSVKFTEFSFLFNRKVAKSEPVKPNAPKEPEPVALLKAA